MIRTHVVALAVFVLAGVWLPLQAVADDQPAAETAADLAQDPIIQQLRTEETQLLRTATTDPNLVDEALKWHRAHPGTPTYLFPGFANHPELREKFYDHYRQWATHHPDRAKEVDREIDRVRARRDHHAHHQQITDRKTHAEKVDRATHDRRVHHRQRAERHASPAAAGHAGARDAR